jgi:glutathione S-transferase
MGLCLGREPTVEPPIFRENVVYLHTFLTSPHVYNISPFAIKVESFLRLNSIPYEMVYTMKFGSKGQIPYVILNGEEICDSNVIIPKLKDYFKTDRDAAALTPEQRACDHAVMRMLEEHTAQIGFYYRYGLHMDEFFEALDVPTRMFHADTSCKGATIAAFWRNFQPGMTKKKMRFRGLAQHSDHELWKFSADDFKALSDLLSEKKYFHGDQASTIDCVVFAQLSQFLFIPIQFPQTAFLNSECINLIAFVHRFRDSFWPDWDKLCAGEKDPLSDSLEKCP